MLRPVKPRTITCEGWEGGGGAEGGRPLAKKKNEWGKGEDGVLRD